MTRNRHAGRSGQAGGLAAASVLLAASWLFSAFGTAAAEPLIMNVAARRSTPLDGSWKVIVDPFETGYYDYRYQPRSDGFFANRKPTDPSELIEYDFDASGSLQVPGDWNTQSERLFFYEGTVWYKRSFDYSGRTDRRLFAYFGAANYQADVYLNGERVGGHEGGFTPFNFELTGRLRRGENTLVVKVDNRRRRDAVPTLNTDWWNYGGLTRSVRLVEVPSTFIRDYFVQLAPDSLDRIAGWIRLDGPQRRQRIAVRIPAAGVRRLIETDETGFAAFDLPAEPQLWSPESPTLHEVWLEAETDSIRERIGFRSVATQATELLLNSRPVFLRGISIHEESPSRGGRALGRDDTRTLLQWAKELGCNYVRLAHYPHDERMLQTADEMGLMVWAEIPVYWTILWDSPEALAAASRQLDEMIARDRNRAAVVIWSVANETPRGQDRLVFLKHLVDRARALDATRLVSAATEPRRDGTSIWLDDPLGEHLDIIGANEYVGWYDGAPEDAGRLTWKTVYDKPLLISEFGGGALAGRHGNSRERWTEEYQERLYRHQIAMLRSIPFLRGVSPWILVDFRSPRRLLPGVQDYWNRKGLISERGEKKKAFFVLQAFYHELAARSGAVR